MCSHTGHLFALRGSPLCIFGLALVSLNLDFTLDQSRQQRTSFLDLMLVIQALDSGIYEIAIRLSSLPLTHTPILYQYDHGLR
jgi:hypothetical protein